MYWVLSSHFWIKKVDSQEILLKVDYNRRKIGRDFSPIAYFLFWCWRWKRFSPLSTVTVTMLVTSICVVYHEILHDTTTTTTTTPDYSVFTQIQYSWWKLQYLSFFRTRMCFLAWWFILMRNFCANVCFANKSYCCLWLPSLQFLS